MPEVQRGGRPRIGLKILLVVVAVLLLVLASSDPILNTWVIPRLVGPGLRTQGWTWEPGHVHLSLTGNLLHVDSLRLRMPLRAAHASLEVTASAITLRGPGWLALLLGREISLKSLEVGALRSVVSPLDSLEAPQEPVERHEEKRPSRPVSIGRLVLSTASLGMHLPVGGLQVDTVASLSLTARDLRFDDAPLTPQAIAGMLRTAEVKLSGLRLEFPSPPYALSVSEAASDGREGLRIRDLEVHPSMDDSAFFGRSPYKCTRFAARCGSLMIPGWRWRSDSSTLSIPAVRFDSLRVDMLANRRKPDDPDTTPLLMPNQMIARLPFGLRIDTVSVRRGLMKYAEQFVYDRRPAALAWTGFTVHATGIANRPAGAPPASVDARGILMGGAAMALHMTLPCTDTLFSMTYTGYLGAMLLPLLNPYLTISDRVRLTSGWCDTVTYGVNIRRGRAEGFVTPLYSGLRVQMLEEKSARTGPGVDVQTFLANAFKMRSMNPEPDKQPRVGHIRNEHAPSAPFFGFLWKSLRGGLGDVVGFGGSP